MLFKIRDNGNLATLNLIDPATGLDTSNDLVKKSRISSIEKEEGTIFYFISQSDYEWWRVVIDEHQALLNRIHALKKIHGTETVDAVIDQPIVFNDIDLLPLQISKYLDLAFGCES